ncbi:MAG: CIA30 family protein [Cyanobacteria bacterium J06626_6]
MSFQEKAQWDAGRFFSTLAYFGEIPFFGSFRWVQQWLGQSPTYAGIDLANMKRNVVLVTSLPTPEASSLLADLQQRLPQLDLSVLKDVQQLTSADSIVIARKTDVSQVLSDITRVLGSTSDDGGNDVSRSVCRKIFDFTSAECELSVWGALDDVVMGGVSQGRIFMSTEPRHAVFAGNVSTENSGGFSSVRTQNFEPPFNLSDWLGLRLRIRGDGQRYKFILRNSAGWDSPAYIYGFDTVADTWISVDVPFSELVPTFRAKSVPGAAPFDPARMVSLQLMLSKFEYDRQLNPRFVPGSFALAVEYIGAYRLRRGESLMMIAEQDELARERQQKALSETALSYRWVERGELDLLDAIAQALG